jgi:hypothetical protein
MNASDPLVEPSAGPVVGDEIRDVLPDDLQPEFAGAYQFPDNSRRRIPGAIYVALAIFCFIAWATSNDSSALVNGGIFWAGCILGVVGLISITSGWRMHVDERDALVAAQQAIGFPVGHASAQQVWHGVRSRPTWRVFCYSAEEPPLQRGLVLVDAVDGRVLQHLAEPNPELDHHIEAAARVDAGDEEPD